MNTNKLETAILGAGCFWCIETMFQKLQGVSKVKSGYSGGHIKNPSYRDVCNGNTGHAEVAKVEFDPEIITFTELLEVFWKIHDPTTLNRQGGDIGTQYRSAIFHTTEKQKEISTYLKERLDESGIHVNPIVTEILEFEIFYPAENYHSDYFNLHGDEGYCRFVIQPKLDTFKKIFDKKLKI